MQAVRNHIHSVKVSNFQCSRRYSHLFSLVAWERSNVSSSGDYKTRSFNDQAQCQQIASKCDITALFQMYTLPEGFVNIDHTTATKHVRAVLNEMKKKRSQYDMSFVIFNY